MRFAVEIQGVAIGYSELEHADTGMGIAVGEFIPTAAYQTVQPVFQQFAEGDVTSYYPLRDDLGLQLRRDDGRLVPTHCIHIADYSKELGPGNAQLEVQLSSAEDWGRFF